MSKSLTELTQNYIDSLDETGIDYALRKLRTIQKKYDNPKNQRGENMKIINNDKAIEYWIIFPNNTALYGRTTLNENGEIEKTWGNLTMGISNSFNGPGFYVRIDMDGEAIKVSDLKGEFLE